MYLGVKRPGLLTSGPGFNPGAAMLDGGFILAARAIHLITVVPACLLHLA